MYQRTLAIATSGRALHECTADIAGLVTGARIDVGLCNVFCRHTSASLIICENADPSVLQDVETFFAALAPDGDPRFVHDAEGPDDMPAHIRSILTQSALTIPIANGELSLGTWQGVFLYEHRTAPHRRELIVTVAA